jgi:hypothetical protein
MIPTVPYLRLRLVLEAQVNAYLPSFKGSLLRGAFGHALRRTACAMGKGQACEGCRLRRACVYTRIFETFIEEAPPPFLRGIPSSPRPYVFEPGDETRYFSTGDPLTFDLLLLGQATELQAYAQLAVERMAANGLGSRRAPFALTAIHALTPDGSWRTVFDDGRGQDTAPLVPCVPLTNGLDATRATLRLLTPLRIKTRGEFANSLTFRELTFAALRRLLELAHFHVPGAAIDWSFRALLERASEVRITRSDLTWHDWERYSNRQQAYMVFGGLVGTLDIEGDLAPFAPLLRAAEIVHIGKGATFGLGKIAVESPGNTDLLHL